MANLSQPATLGNLKQTVENMKVYIDSDKTVSIKGYLKENNTHKFYNTSIPTVDTTPIFSFDVTTEYFLDQTKTTFVQEFAWSDATYTGSTNPNLDGKPVFVLAVKGEDSISYSFVNLEALIDTYKTKDTTTLSLDITDNEISGNVNISAEKGNAVVVKEDGLYVPTTAETKVSEIEDNAIEVKDDGIYVKDMSTKISAEQDNALIEKQDGLYVPSVSETKVSAETGNQIIQKDDGIYVAPTDLTNYVEKVDGKGLSTNDLTNEMVERIENTYSKDETYSRAEVDEAITNAQIGGEDVDLSSYATKEYVDNAVNDVNVDLTGYATETFVTDKIAEIEIPSLDGYAKTEDVPTVTNDLTDELKSNYDEAYDNTHTHDNKDALDSITSEKITSWDNKSDFDGSYNSLTDTPTELPASDVYEWAKEETKPTYTYDEVGADKEGSADTALIEAKAYTDEKIDAIVGEGASETLDTIGEISKAIEDNEDVVEALNSAIGNKVDKVEGKGLSTNDLTDTLKSNYDTAYTNTHTHSNKTVLDNTTASYTTAEKTKLSGITESADAVSFTQSLTSGTKVGTININGTDTALYAPTNTDTHYTSKNVVGSTSATSNTTTALTNGNVYLNSVENGSVTSTHKISGSGATTVTTDTSGNIVITSTDNNTVTTATTTGSGNAVTAIAASNGALTVTKGSTFLTTHPTISTSTDTTSTATATHGGTVTMVDSVTRDGNGHVTKINTKTVTLPSDADTKYTHPTTSGNKHIPSGGSSGQILRWSADGTAVWGADNNTTYGVVSTTADGLAPKRDGSTTKYLRADGTWATPPDNNTTYNNMTAATSSAAGKAGLVPAPAAGAQAKFLRGDGTWQTPTNTTYSNFVKSGSGAKAGLVPAPSTTAGTTKYLREDGTWTTPPDTNTTYSTATQSAQGLMSASDKTKLDGIASGANAYTLPTASSSTLGGVKTTSTVTSTSGLTASPIIDGVPYYDKRTAISSPLSNSTTFGTYYPVLCSSVATNVSSLSVDTGIKFGSRSGSLTLDGSNTTTSDSSFVSLAVKMPKSGQYSSTGISITPAGTSAYHTGMSINCGTSTGPGMRGLIISCTANTHQPTLEIVRTGGTNSYAISCQKGKSYIADIYSNAAINTTSDREKKMDIKDITSDYEELFFKLQPRLFKYKDGNSGRIHIGAIAQEVEEALDAVGIDDSNFAGFVRQEKDYKVNEETGEVTQEEGYDYYLRYEEFIMLLCHMLQKLYAEKEEQDNKISDLESRIVALEGKLG